MWSKVVHYGLLPLEVSDWCRIIHSAVDGDFLHSDLSVSYQLLINYHD